MFSVDEMIPINDVVCGFKVFSYKTWTLNHAFGVFPDNEAQINSFYIVNLSISFHQLKNWNIINKVQSTISFP